jgi:NADH-quinone oxidoreductase subunit E
MGDTLVREIIERYEGDTGMLISILQDVQAARGYLPEEDLRAVAGELELPLVRVFGIARFYSSFRLTPRGRHDVTLCTGTVCHLRGAPRISEAICDEFGIEPGGTTRDRLFTFQTVNCVGACALAPVMVVDGAYHDGVTPEKALELIGALKVTEASAGEVPS